MATMMPAALASAEPAQVCHRFSLVSPAPGQDRVSLQPLFGVEMVEDPSCATPGQGVLELELPPGGRVELRQVTPFEPATWTPQQPLLQGASYQLRLRVGEMVVTERTVTAHEGELSAAELSNLSITVGVESSYGVEFRVAQIQLELESGAPYLGPLEVSFGPDATGLGQAFDSAAAGQVNGVLRLVPAPGPTSFSIRLGTEERWPHEQTCTRVRALESAAEGECRFGNGVCLKPKSELSTCAPSPTGCSGAGAPGPVGLAWWASLALATWRRRTDRR